MAWRVLLARPVPCQLSLLPEPVHQRVLERLRALADQPRTPGCVKLEGDVYRIRFGDYRAVYSVSDSESVVLLLRIVRRSEKPYHALAANLRQDEADLRLMRDRRKEPTRPYEEFRKELKREGLI